MNGIIFFQTTMLEQLRKFYIDQVGASVWLEQVDCVVFKHGNFLFGFCQRENADINGILCFFYNDRKTVDELYAKFQSIAQSPPIDNPKYDIYHFFAVDPENRVIEFQSFNKIKNV